MSAHINDFGAVPNDFTLAAAALNVSALFSALAASRNVKADPDQYYFGPISGNDHLVTWEDFDRRIDWRGAHIFVDGDNSGPFTSATFLTARDCRIDMHDYEFTDRNFTFAGPSRGVRPLGIESQTKSSSGFTLGPFKVHKGQSLISVGAWAPDTYRSSNITFVGNCQGVDTYYGVNLANDGDAFQGDYTLGRFFRSMFAYGVDGVQARIIAREGQASSSNLLINHHGRHTRNFDIDAQFGSIDGPICLAFGSTTASPEMTGITINAKINGVGGNIDTSKGAVVVKQYDTSGNVRASGDYLLEAAIRVQSDPSFTGSVRCHTATSGRAKICAAGDQQEYHSIGANTSAHWVSGDGRMLARSAVGPLNLVGVALDTSVFRSGPIALRGTLRARVDVYSGPVIGQAEYDVVFKLDNSGNVTGFIPSLKTLSNFGGSVAPINLWASGPNIYVSSSGAGTAMGEIDAELWLQ